MKENAAPMCFIQSDILYLRLRDAEGGLGQIEESIYVKDIDTQIIHEVTNIHFEM